MRFILHWVVLLRLGLLPPDPEELVNNESISELSEWTSPCTCHHFQCCRRELKVINCMFKSNVTIFFFSRLQRHFPTHLHRTHVDVYEYLHWENHKIAQVFQKLMHIFWVSINTKTSCSKFLSYSLNTELWTRKTATDTDALTEAFLPSVVVVFFFSTQVQDWYRRTVKTGIRRKNIRRQRTYKEQWRSRDTEKDLKTEYNRLRQVEEGAAATGRMKH